MSRIAKSDVNAALDRAAKNIIDAAGRDGIVSRKDIEKKLDGLTGTEKALTDRFFRFIDHRDYRTGNRITAADVERATTYAKEHLLKKYDVNNNGFSSSEIANMSRTGQLAVALAAELKGVQAPQPPSTSALGDLFTVAARDTFYVSEGDSQPAFVEAAFPANKPITGAAIMDVFAQHIAGAYDEQDGDLSAYTFEESDGNEMLRDLATSDPNDEDYYKENAKGFARIKKVFDENLTDVKAFRIGPKESDGSMAVDQGAYQYLIVGRTGAGKLAGVAFESVET